MTSRFARTLAASLLTLPLALTGAIFVGCDSDSSSGGSGSGSGALKACNTNADCGEGFICTQSIDPLGGIYQTQADPPGKSCSSSSDCGSTPCSCKDGSVTPPANVA